MSISEFVSEIGDLLNSGNSGKVIGISSTGQPVAVTGGSGGGSGGSVNRQEWHVLTDAATPETFTFTHVVGYLDVYKNGIKLESITGFTDIDSTHFSVNTTSGDYIFAECSTVSGSLTSIPWGAWTSFPSGIGTGHRALGTTFSGSSTQATVVSVTARINAPQAMTFYINGAIAATSGTTGNDTTFNLTLIVPPSATYEVTGSSFVSWEECLMGGIQGPAGAAGSGGIKDYQEFTTPGSFTWTAPSSIISTDIVIVEMIGGGGGGGNGTNMWGGGGGGGGGAYAKAEVKYQFLSSTVTGTVGAGGAGGAGGNGGASIFGNVSGGTVTTGNLFAGGGFGGSGGGGAATTGGSGGSSVSTGVSAFDYGGAGGPGSSGGSPGVTGTSAQNGGSTSFAGAGGMGGAYARYASNAYAGLSCYGGGSGGQGTAPSANGTGVTSPSDSVSGAAFATNGASPGGGGGGGSGGGTVGANPNYGAAGASGIVRVWVI